MEFRNFGSENGGQTITNYLPEQVLRLENLSTIFSAPSLWLNFIHQVIKNNPLADRISEFNNSKYNI